MNITKRAADVAVEKQLFRINEFTAAFGPSRTKIMNLLREGRLKAIKSGRSILITRESIQDWLRECPKAG